MKATNPIVQTLALSLLSFSALASDNNQAQADWSVTIHSEFQKTESEMLAVQSGAKEKVRELKLEKPRESLLSPRALGKSVEDFGFFFHDAWLDYTVDYDGDGFASEFSLIMDADFEFGSALVFADIYMAKDGGTFRYIHTTNNFWINGLTSSDAYEVFTILSGDFGPGYYEIAIDLYEVGFAEPVATIDGLDTEALLDIPLEKSAFDEPLPLPEPEPVIVVESYSSGSLGGFWVLMLGLLVPGFGRQLNRKKPIGN